LAPVDPIGLGKRQRRADGRAQGRQNRLPFDQASKALARLLRHRLRLVRHVIGKFAGLLTSGIERGLARVEARLRPALDRHTVDGGLIWADTASLAGDH
jgi:hypothetical protein